MKNINKLNNKVNNAIEKLINASEYLMNETNVDLSLFSNLSVGLKGVEKMVVITGCLDELKELLSYVKENDLGTNKDTDEMLQKLEELALTSIGTFKENLKASGMELQPNGSKKLKLVSVNQL